jgi:phosphonopyruvate decarboxylase
MIPTERFVNALKESGFDFFAGVPDSTLKDLIKCISSNAAVKNTISPNEGTAIASCAGYHLATGKTGVVYMQNAGLGNAVNPLTSLTDKEVYCIPILLIIGWRGEPGKKDEPQHKKMGAITLPMLDVLGIKYAVLADDNNQAISQIIEAKKHTYLNQAPFALIIKEGTFEKFDKLENPVNNFEMTREDAITAILDNMRGEEIIVSTTGKTSRELFEYRHRKNQGHGSDFLTVGSMGHSSSIAHGIATQTEKQVYIFDGDGAVIMHLGALTTIGESGQTNLKHIVFDNEAYESTGGQPTLSGHTDICNIAFSCGYKRASKASSKEELIRQFKSMQSEDGPSLLLVKVSKGSRKDLGRPTTSPIENKTAFMKNFEHD